MTTTETPLLGEEMLAGLKDWSVGYTNEKVAETLGDPGPYQVVLTFDDRETVGLWVHEMTKTSESK